MQSCNKNTTGTYKMDNITLNFFKDTHGLSRSSIINSIENLLMTESNTLSLTSLVSGLTNQKNIDETMRIDIIRFLFMRNDKDRAALNRMMKVLNINKTFIITHIDLNWIKDMTLLQFLIEDLKICVNTIFHKGTQKTLLHSFINKDSQCVKYILSKGADVNIVNDIGETSLYFLCKHYLDDGKNECFDSDSEDGSYYSDRTIEYPECISLLFGAGIDPYIFPINNMSLINIISKMLEKGIKRNIFGFVHVSQQVIQYFFDQHLRGRRIVHTFARDLIQEHANRANKWFLEVLNPNREIVINYILKEISESNGNDDISLSISSFDGILENITNDFIEFPSFTNRLNDVLKEKSIHASREMIDCDSYIVIKFSNKRTKTN